nr:unnamed protein product [Callosobruchus analis]
MTLHCCPSILPFITHIYNFCITNKVFPNLWKKANVIPLPKKDTVQDFNDLRPVSILCALPKPLEKLLEKQIREYVNYNEILPIQQSGFRSKHICVTALLKVTDDIYRPLDNSELCILVLLDFLNAFNRIYHELLSA